MNARVDHSPRRVSWFEAFYDLIIVATLVAINDAFLDNPTPLNALAACLGAAAIFTVWLLTSLAVNKNPTENLVKRLLVLVQMAALVWVVVAVMEVATFSSTIGLLSYGIALLTVAALWWRGQGRRYTSLALVAAGVVSFAGTLLPAEYTWLVLAGATGLAALPAITEWATSTVEKSVEPSHFAERMGLFVLIVLGLSFGQLVIDLSYSTTNTDLRFFILMFVIMFTIWWMYFGLKVPEHPLILGKHRRAWITAHYLLLVGIAGLGDIVSALTSYGDDEIAVDGAGYLGLALALVLTGIAILVASPSNVGHRAFFALIPMAVLVLLVGVIIDIFEAWDLRMFTLLGAVLLIAEALLLAWWSRRSTGEALSP